MLDTVTRINSQPQIVEPTNYVDQLGTINAAIAKLQDQADAIKDSIKASGIGTYDGELFQVKVSIYEQTKRDAAFKTRIDEYVAGLDPRYVKNHTFTDEVVRLSIKSR